MYYAAIDIGYNNTFTLDKLGVLGSVVLGLVPGIRFCQSFLDTLLCCMCPGIRNVLPYARGVIGAAPGAGRPQPPLGN